MTATWDSRYCPRKPVEIATISGEEKSNETDRFGMNGEGFANSAHCLGTVSRHVFLCGAGRLKVCEGEQTDMFTFMLTPAFV